jgi:hypothetical protein
MREKYPMCAKCIAKKFSLCAKNSKHLEGHEGSIHNGRLEWRNVNQENGCKLHSKDFLTNELLLEDKRENKYFKLMESKKLVWDLMVTVASMVSEASAPCG